MCCSSAARSAHRARAKLAGFLTCQRVPMGTDVRTIRWSAATISTPIETFQLFATKKKEVGADHMDKTHAMFHAMNKFMTVHHELPKVVSKFVLHSIGPTGRERMSIGRLGAGEVMYRPNKGHRAEDKDGDGVIDDEGVNKDVLRLSIALDLVRKMEVNSRNALVRGARLCMA